MEKKHIFTQEYMKYNDYQCVVPIPPANPFHEELCYQKCAVGEADQGPERQRQGACKSSCGNLEVTGLPKKTRMTAAELAEILEPIAYPPIG